MSFTPDRPIALYLPSLRGGGAERAMLLFAGGLVEAGFSVDLVLAEAAGPLKPFVPRGVRVVDFGQKRVFRTIPQLVRYMRASRPLGLYSTIAHANVAALIAAKIAGVKTPVIVRESNMPSKAPRNTIAARVVCWLVPRVYRWARAVIAVSGAVAEELTAKSAVMKKLVTVLPNPVVSPELFERANEVPQHPWATERVPFILAAGRLHPQKDFDTLLHAFALVRRHRAVRLIVLGEGAERRALESLAASLGVAEHVSFPGFVENPLSFMNRARVFVLSSRYEGMPNVLIQAMALGTPVVSTDCPGGSREILRSGEYGHLVPVGDPGALAAAISASLDAPRRHDVAEQISEQFGVSRAVQQYLEPLQACR